MTDYADSTDLGYLTTSIADSVSANLKAYAIEISNTWVNSIVQNVSTTSIPDLVQKAATYYAYAFILRNLYDTSMEDTPVAMWYEKEAYRLLGAYSAQNTQEADATNPYASSQSPGYIYSGRNKRTSYDDTDYNDIDESTWTSDD